MEFLYQPEEVIFSANYESLKLQYYTSQVAVPTWRTNPIKSFGIIPEEDVRYDEISCNASFPQLAGSSLVDTSQQILLYFHNACASQQPHCVWQLVNMGLCLFILLIHVLMRKVFGKLRTSEVESMKDQMWNLVFYKVVFVFGVANVEDVEDAVGWFVFVSIISLLQLSRQLCHERHNYLILMNDWTRRGRCRRHRILGLLSFIFVSSIFLCASVGGWYFFSSPNEKDLKGAIGIDVLKTTLTPPSDPPVSEIPDFVPLSLHSAVFMMCELGLLVIQTMHVLIICVLEQLHSRWPKGQRMSEDTYSNLCNALNFRFEMISLLFDLVHHLHMLVCCNLFLSMTSLIVSLQMRNRVRQIHRVLKKRQSYLWLNEHIDQYSDAVFGEEVSSSPSASDKCPICWENFVTSSQRAKSLPCHHIFHAPCLRQWLLVSMNCPSCRLTLVSEKEMQYRSGERTTRRLYAPRPVGLLGFLQTGQALLDLFGGWDPQYDDSYDEDPDHTSPPQSGQVSVSPNPST